MIFEKLLPLLIYSWFQATTIEVESPEESISQFTQESNYVNNNEVHHITPDFSFQKMALPLPSELTKENHFDIFVTGVHTTAEVTATILTKDEDEFCEMFKNMNMRYNAGAGDNLNLKVDRPTINGTYAAKLYDVLSQKMFEKLSSKVNFF